MTDRMNMLESVAEAARRALDYHDRNACTHETTHRGGFIWTICDDCGQKWADDKGGFVPYTDAPAISELRSALDALPAEPVGDTVTMALIRATKTGDFAGTMHPDQEDPRDWEHVGNLVFHAPARVTLPTITARVET